MVPLQESVEPTAEVAKTFNEKIKKYCDITLLSLAYAGTGNVLKVNSLYIYPPPSFSPLLPSVAQFLSRYFPWVGNLVFVSVSYPLLLPLSLVFIVGQLLSPSCFLLHSFLFLSPFSLCDIFS